MTIYKFMNKYNSAIVPENRSLLFLDCELHYFNLFSPNFRPTWGPLLVEGKIE